MYSYNFQYTVPEFTLTESDIQKPFSNTIEYLEEIGINQFGACKFTMPDMSKWKKPIDQLKPIKQISWQTFEASDIDEDVYYLIDSKENKKRIKVSKFHERFPNKDYIIDIDPSRYNDDAYIDELENKLFERISRINVENLLFLNEKENLSPAQIANFLPPIAYGSGVDDSLFYESNHEIWNPNHLGTLTDLIPKLYSTKRHNLKDKEGVTSSFLYHAAPLSIFGNHCEDINLGAYSYNNGPSPKIWYIIPPKYAQDFEKVMKENFPKEFEACEGILQHKYFFFNPKFLIKHNLPYARIVQKANEVVVLSPHTYHFGFNAGPNLAEAVNYGTHEWLQNDMATLFTPCKGINKDKKCGMHKSVVLNLAALESHRGWDIDITKDIYKGYAEKFKLPNVPLYLKVERKKKSTPSNFNDTAPIINYNIPSTSNQIVMEYKNCDNKKIKIKNEGNQTNSKTKNVRISPIHESFAKTCILKFVKINSDLAKQCTIVSENNHGTREGRCSWVCDDKCEISQTLNFFCFLRDRNCFLKFHLELDGDKHYPTHGVLAKCKAKYNGKACGGNTSIICYKCGKHYCLTEKRNCFYACEH